MLRPLQITACLTAFLCACLSIQNGFAQQSKSDKSVDLKQVFLHPPEDAKSWVYWYWMRSAVTQEGISADLKAMAQQGIGGAYMMTVRQTPEPPFIDPPVPPLSPKWWELVRFTMAEAKKLGLKLAMTPCDGWALAGGPWITPELSMQKVVWTKTTTSGNRLFKDTLARPEAYEGYYKDIAVYAYPTPKGATASVRAMIPKVTSSLKYGDFQFLAVSGNKKELSSKVKCWIQLEFPEPFTCRSLTIKTNKSNYQSQRLIVEVSDDGQTFRSLGRLMAPRHGWQDDDLDLTHSIAPVTGRFFRLVYDPKGSEPGSEDLDLAKWKPELKLCGIEFSAEPRIHQYEGKTGAVWRVGKRTTEDQLPEGACVPVDKLINLTEKLVNGRLVWEVPAGEWTILRIGHTSTGHKNAAAGSASGLECDKFSPAAAKLQFDSWFGEALRLGGLDATKEVVKIFHVDSWECGSQNWSPLFASEFEKRRGYDLLKYLPVMTGLPIESAEVSEKVLSDVRQTIADLTTDNFFGVMQKLAHEKGCSFSAESVAPTMTGDGMLHFSKVDIPMGEFWYRSPTHDKPNDVLDAVSGGHIYGKNIIQAEAFTELRLMWDEHPAMLKTLTDRSFAVGINRFALHVNAHNPWTDRKPGMTLDGIGLFFQRDQTWWKPGRAWMDYIQRCQAMLQQGRPVVDVAVFTGEEIPRRAVLPDRLLSTLPGIFGAKRIREEKARLTNMQEPMREITEGFFASANMAYPEKWVDPLMGYAYDSINKDALLRLASVRNGRIELPGGASYAVLVIPGPTLMSPDAALMSSEVLLKLSELAAAGATIIINEQPYHSPGMEENAKVKEAAKKLFSNPDHKLVKAPYLDADFKKLSLEKDAIFSQADGEPIPDIAWIHRVGNDFDLYFISNQQGQAREIHASLRSSMYPPELWDPLTAESHIAGKWEVKDGRTKVAFTLAANGSVFVVMRKNGNDKRAQKTAASMVTKTVNYLSDTWQVKFDPEFGGPIDTQTFSKYDDWSKRAENAIKYYSGTAIYTQQFDAGPVTDKEGLWLEFDSIANVAEVYVNGVHCGVAWTAPYRVNISKALKPGSNLFEIEVTNTWSNRLTGDEDLPEEKRITWTNKSPVKMKNRPLLPAGILGKVKLIKISQ